jgi:hypothetical protein
MNSSAKKLINDAIKGLIEKLEQTEKFVLEQAPDICKQMVTDQMIRARMDIVITSVLLFLSAICFIHAWPHEFFTDSQPTRYFFISALGFCFGVFGICCGYESVHTIFYLKYCPKLFLLREFKSLVETKKA